MSFDFQYSNKNFTYLDKSSFFISRKSLSSSSEKKIPSKRVLKKILMKERFYALNSEEVLISISYTIIIGKYY